MNKVIDKLPALVAEELAAANVVHSLFHSPHEGYAVLLEEVEEVKDELRCVEDNLTRLWGCVRADAFNSVPGWARYLENAAMQLAAEAIQVAAMARKMQDSLKGVGTNESD